MTAGRLSARSCRRNRRCVLHFREIFIAKSAFHLSYWIHVEISSFLSHLVLATFSLQRKAHEAGSKCKLSHRRRTRYPSEKTFSRLEGGKGKPATPRRERTLRKHRHVTRSPAASHPVVARCTASCRPLPSPPARYASRPRPHLSAKFHRASASSSAEGCESKLPSATDGFRKRVHRRMRERPRGATGGRAPRSITVDAIRDAGRRVDAR